MLELLIFSKVTSLLLCEAFGGDCDSGTSNSTLETYYSNFIARQLQAQVYEVQEDSIEPSGVTCIQIKLKETLPPSLGM